jgi:uncharacterized protein
VNPNTLRRVQELDSHIVTLRDEQRQATSMLERDPEVERLRTLAERSGVEQREMESALAALEQELRTVSERARSMHRRLYGGSVRNPQELLEMQHELESLTGRVAALEEQALAAMEAAEQAADSATAAAGALQEAERQRAADAGPLQERLTSLGAALTSAEAERESAFAELSPAERTLYTRVAAKHRPAVVSIRGDACGGCHLPLSIEERRAVRSGERVVQCSSCDRILVP